MKTNIPNRKEALGKGIRSLLQNIDTDLSATERSLMNESGDKKILPIRESLLARLKPIRISHDMILMKML